MLESRISTLGDENSRAVGDALEIFVEAYLATQPIAQCEETWLVGEIPLHIRHDLILPHDAKGIDGVYRTKHASLVPYQVKFRSKRAYLTFTELAGFIGVTDRAEERVVFTNSNELAEDIARRPGLRVVRGIDFDRLEPTELKAIEDWLKERPVQEPKGTPRDYQEAALRDISSCLSENDRAHVVMACGTGKTLIALWSAERLGARQILVLLPSLSLLRQTLQEWSKRNSWGRDYSYIADRQKGVRRDTDRPDRGRFSCRYRFRDCEPVSWVAESASESRLLDLPVVSCDQPGDGEHRAIRYRNFRRGSQDDGSKGDKLRHGSL